MDSISKQIEQARESIKKGPADVLKMNKPFALGMYRFAMFMIDYYARVRDKLKIDYDSFIILQTVISHTLYLLNKKEFSPKSYLELEKEWEKLINKNDINQIMNKLIHSNSKNNTKLTISSICLVTSLPKETVRRKVNELVKKNLLKISKKEGVNIGSMYKKVFREFVPQTTAEVAKLLNSWEKIGILKNLLKFKF